MRHMTDRVPNIPASFQSSRQSMTPTRAWRIHVAKNRIAAWARHVVAKAKAKATSRDRLFEISLTSDIENTLLMGKHWSACRFRLSFIDGGGRPMHYEDGVFKKFDQAIADVDKGDVDSTLLFIATDGSRIYKAFAGPDSSVGEKNPYLSSGFDDETYIGIWSHSWLQNIIADLERGDDPDSGWEDLMGDMVTAIADYADLEEK